MEDSSPPLSPYRGKTREQAIDEITVPAYANLPGGAARIRMNIASIYDELKATR